MEAMEAMEAMAAMAAKLMMVVTRCSRVAIKLAELRDS